MCFGFGERCIFFKDLIVRVRRGVVVVKILFEVIVLVEVNFEYIVIKGVVVFMLKFVFLWYNLFIIYVVIWVEVGDEVYGGVVE